MLAPVEIFHAISSCCCHETTNRKILSTNACDAGTDSISRTTGPVSLYSADSHLLGPEFDSILSVQVCLSQI